jgi:hypothetical protein
MSTNHVDFLTLVRPEGHGAGQVLKMQRGGDVMVTVHQLHKHRCVRDSTVWCSDNEVHEIYGSMRLLLSRMRHVTFSQAAQAMLDLPCLQHSLQAA